MLVLLMGNAFIGFAIHDNFHLYKPLAVSLKPLTMFKKFCKWAFSGCPGKLTKTVHGGTMGGTLLSSLGWGGSALPSCLGWGGSVLRSLWPASCCEPAQASHAA